MEVLLDGSTDTGALSNPNPALALPKNHKAVGTYYAFRLLFGGSDAADETINYQVIGWTRGINEAENNKGCYVPTLLAKGVVTLGSTTYSVAGLGNTNNLWADTITNTLTTSPKDVLHSPADNSIAFLEVDVQGFVAVTVDIDLGTAASADVFVEGLGESVT